MATFTLRVTGPVTFFNDEDIADTIESAVGTLGATSFCHRNTRAGEMSGDLEAEVEPSEKQLARVAKLLGKRYRLAVTPFDSGLPAW